MPRRKQDCPKRMKWEGGEEGSPEEEGEKVECDEDSQSESSVASVEGPGEDDANSQHLGDPPSPRSPRSIIDDEPPPINNLPEREYSSPMRCQSPNSDESDPPTLQSPRCHSGDSIYRSASHQQVMLGSSLPISFSPGAASVLSPVGVTLPPTLPASAAAALLPPQSAAMAAYLNAAAAAAAAAQHSHRLMMTSPLPSAYHRSSISPLVSSSSSPTGVQALPLRSPDVQPLPSPVSEGILDFSNKRLAPKNDDSDNVGDVMNLSKEDSPPRSDVPFNSPLDLSVTTRKRVGEELLAPQPVRKARTIESIAARPSVVPQWASPSVASHLPYFAAAVAAASSLSPKTNQSPDNLWNGKLKHNQPTPNDATKALEKMSELSKLGGEDLFRSMTNTGSVATTNSANSRHSAWQSHWLNKGAESAKDVLKCVWCKQSFPSLAALTTHMKEAKHCGVNVPVPPMHMQPQQIPPHQHLHNTSPSNTSTNSSSSNSNTNKIPSQSDLNLLIKETMPLPRKLVRGQDVWLGKGAEQTRQILKCMWCGQSFRSLAEMTSHMQQTQHYTNIISQEQIISWRSSEDPKNGSREGASSGNTPAGGPQGNTSSHVSAVLTCKVCDQAFSSLKDLSNHMVKNSHYKEHIMRSITESGGRRRQTREKRKKSLPVRKLLELERAQHDFKNGDNGIVNEKPRDPASAGRITCEKCGNKIETSLFVDHIRQCVGGISTSQRNFLKSALMSNNIIPPVSPREKVKPNKSPSPVTQIRSPPAPEVVAKEPSPAASENNNGSSTSVLNALEKLIEKSFDSRGRQNTNFPGQGNATAPMGSSILKRLGIDESVDYTKPLVDAQTMNLMRSYHHHQHPQFGRRERSGSESSSISERGSSRMDSLTPERKLMDPPLLPLSSTPRSTPDRRDKSPFSEKANDSMHDEVIIKKEIVDDSEVLSVEVPTIKREIEEPMELVKQEVRSPNVKDHSPSPANSPHHIRTPSDQRSPGRNSSSPASSERSGTPRSSNGDRKGGSLGALSSMFDNLSGAAANIDGGIPSGKRGRNHPLAALQKLCDKTETHHTTSGRTSTSNTVTATTSSGTPTNLPSTTSSVANPGAILAFSWACNDAVMTSDSIMKCAFCDTPFISKGAYRHHLSKMHFVKDGMIPDPVTLKSTQPSHMAHYLPSTSSTTSTSSSLNAKTPQPTDHRPSSKSPPTGAGFEESPHSKFLKYTELAKQLSSKYV